MKSILKNKQGMLARDFIIILVLFGLVTGVGFLIVEDMASEEGYDIEGMSDENYESKYNTLTDASESIYSMQNETTSKEGTSAWSTYTTTFKATFSVIGFVFDGVSLPGKVIKNTLVDVGTPTTLANLVGGGITVLIIAILVFVIISSVSRGKL